MKELDKTTALASLAQEIIDKNVCLELKQQATQLVMGDGNVNAKIVFIGEAPGKSEDLQGVPFVGASGKFLNVMLEAAGMDRADVYITNIVKYRPPNNRDPKTVEKEAFWPYLERQLEIIGPKVIITLGRHSMGSFLPKAQIAEVHGQPQQIQVGGQLFTIVPLYHPAAALYNGSLRQTLIDDFLKISKTL
ncbi:MAG: uracil-DNA glycosylase [Candidatus Microsaccharimonas sp.]